MGLEPEPAQQLRKVRAQDLNKHVRGKRDLWQILAVVGQYHLPNFDTCTVHFMREILAGRKKVFKLKDLHPVCVPRISEFKADLLYEHCMKDPKIKPYLPDPALDSTRRPCGRKFLFDVGIHLFILTLI